MSYESFLAEKSFNKISAGFDPVDLNINLKPHQEAIVTWACKRGRAAIFADTGLGKTLMQLEWANQVVQKTGKPVLLLAPLAVGKQTENEASKFSIDATTGYIREFTSDLDIVITNYEMLDNFNPDDFAGIVLDESSILKGQTGTYRKKLTSFAKNIEYRLSCTATPSPNDYMELGTQCEFLGIMSQVEMLAMFFTHDGSETQKWRLKGHAASKFWEWLATWAVVISNPSDLGFDGHEYELPPLEIHEVILDSHASNTLFAEVAQGLSAARNAKRKSMDRRVRACAELVNSLDDDCVVWCETNGESDLLSTLTDDAITVTGSDSPEFKVNAIYWFLGYNDFVINYQNKKPCLVKNTSSNTMLKTERKRLLTQENGNKKTPTIESNTCKSTERVIVKNGKDRQNSKQKSIRGEEKSTQKTRSIENSKKQNQKIIKKETQDKDLIRELKNTELQQTTTTQCSQARTGSAGYAGAPTQTTQGTIDCTSITATKQDMLEGCCASNVITELENSKTQSICLKRQSSTSKRVIISKPSIFGYGLNMQHACKMAFSGATYSFEQFYQAVRREWRFGQTKQVDVWVFMTEEEVGIHGAMMRKMEQDQSMRKEMIKVMSSAMRKEITGAKVSKTDYDPTVKASLPSFM